MPKICSIVPQTLTRLQFWSFVLSRAPILRGLQDALGDVIGPSHVSYAKLGRKTFSSLYEHVTSLTEEESAVTDLKDYPEPCTHDASLVTNPNVNPWTLAMKIQARGEYNVILCAVANITGTPVPQSIAQEPHSQHPQGREFTRHALDQYPNLRMLRLAAGAWAGLARPAERTNHSAALAAQLPFANVIYHDVVLPALRIDQVYNFRVQFERFLRHYVTPRPPPRAATLPAGMRRDDLCRYWLFWDWETVDDDLEHTIPPGGLSRNADITELDKFLPKLVLQRALQTSINRTAQGILRCLAAQWSVEFQDGSDGRTQVCTKLGPLWEDIREPFDILMRVRVGPSPHLASNAHSICHPAAVRQRESPDLSLATAFR